MTAVTPVTTFEDAQAYLYSRFDFERTMVARPVQPFKLDRMRQLAARLGSPHKHVKAVHIAGTKGKGSTATMTASILRYAGIKTGLFTSPHLTNLRQRFQIDGHLCSEIEFVSLVNQLIPVVWQMDQEQEQSPELDLKPTFFELTTALAFLFFQQNHVEIAVLEVGLGGRLDSTNICESIVTAITSISLDHMSLLGNCVEEIAAEKAGIIKPDIPLVHGCQQAGPRREIETIATQSNAYCLNAAQDITFQISRQTAHDSTLCNVTIDINQAPKTWPQLTIGLPGKHQIQNALVVLGIMKFLTEQGYTISDDAITTGLAAASCPGRMELVAQQPPVLLDVAHNPDSIEKLIHYLQQHFSEKPWHLVFSCSQDKQVTEMLEKLLGECTTATFTQFQNNPRAASCQDLYQLAKTLLPQTTGGLHVEPDPMTALEQVRKRAAAEDLIVVTGSFYLVAEIRERLVCEYQHS